MAACSMFAMRSLPSLICYSHCFVALRCQLTSWVPDKLKPAFLRSDQPQQSEADLLSRQGSRASLLSREGSTASQMLQDRAISSRASRSGKAPKRSKRPTPGFRRQFAWCLSRVALQRTREPLIVVTDYAIFALTGMVQHMTSGLHYLLDSHTLLCCALHAFSTDPLLMSHTMSVSSCPDVQVEALHPNSRVSPRN